MATELEDPGTVAPSRSEAELEKTASISILLTLHVLVVSNYATYHIAALKTAVFRV